MIPVEEKIQIVQRAIDISKECMKGIFPNSYMCNMLSIALYEHGYMSQEEFHCDKARFTLLATYLPEFYDIPHKYNNIDSCPYANIWKEATLPSGRFDLLDYRGNTKWKHRITILQYLKSIYENM